MSCSVIRVFPCFLPPGGGTGGAGGGIRALFKKPRFLQSRMINNPDFVKMSTQIAFLCQT